VERRIAGNPMAWEDREEERWEDGEVRVENQCWKASEIMKHRQDKIAE